MTVLNTPHERATMQVPTRLAAVGMFAICHGLFVTRSGPMSTTERRIARADK